MFGFFNKWRRAGRGVGIKNGVGKLCQFDADGNVIASSVSPSDVGGKLYQHTVTLTADSGSPADAEVQFVIYNRSSAPLNTWAKLRDATPTYTTLCCGYFLYGGGGVRYQAVRVYRQGTGTNARITAEAYLGTGQSMPAFYDFENATSYDPTDHVKEI